MNIKGFGKHLRGAVFGILDRWEQFWWLQQLASQTTFSSEILVSVLSSGERDRVSDEMAHVVNIKMFIKHTERLSFILLGPYRPIRDRWYVALNVGGSRNKQNSKNRDMQRDGSLDTTCHATREAFGSTLTCCERSGTNHNVLTAHIQMSGKCNEI